MIEDWHETRIEDIAERIAMGPFGSDIKVDNFVPQGVPIIRGGNLSSGRFNDDNFVYLTEGKADKLSAANAFPDDIVFTHRGTLGQVGIIPKTKFARYVVSQSQMKLTCKTNLAAPPFIYYFFKSNIGQQALLINTSQTGVPAISRPVTSLKNITILLPPLPEQRRIAHILGTLDDKIENNRKTAKTLEAMAQAIFRSWFVDFDPVRAKMAGESPESICKRLKLTPEILDLFPDRLVDSELGEIPEGWEVGTFGDLCNSVQSGGTPKRIVAQYWNGQIDWLTSGEVRNSIVFEAKEKISETALAESNAKLWPAGTTVVAMYGATAGEVCLLAAEMCTNQACCGLIPLPNYEAFLFFYVRNERRYIADKSSGSAQQNLNKGLVENYSCFLPVESTIIFFQDVVDCILKRWIIYERECRALIVVRDSLLPKLISGDIRLTEVEDLIVDALL